MDTTAFYAIVAGTCFALVGLWWSVVEKREEFFRDESARRLATGVNLSFLLPAVMSLGAQVGGSETPIIWRGVFVLTALTGLYVHIRLVRQLPRGKQGIFLRAQWAVVLIYALVLIFGFRPQLAGTLFNLKPLQVEGLLLVLLVIMAHGLAWDVLMKTRKA